MKDQKKIQDLLYKSLQPTLKAIYRTQVRLSNNRLQNYEDCRDDFYLFLYHGPDYMRTAGLPPFSILENIDNPECLNSWIASAFRLFLIHMANRPGVGQLAPETCEKYAGSTDVPELTGLEDDSNPEAVCDAIAYCLQECSAMGRFLLLRWLLSVLDKNLEIPQRPMAAAAGISHAQYRVGTKRQKDKLAKTVRQRLEKGTVSLDAQHAELSRELQDNIDSLYGCLKEHYEKCIDNLPNGRYINALREEQGAARGLSLHDPHDGWTQDSMPETSD